ncbi:hypothetical protein ABWJ92_09465 [Streptomyces sp. NPDC000609]|uniref:hypothetical protein n=1 Tax=Streptomyces sp. NPDC000609 TaxID=3160957 RepID=UPI00339A2A38
MISNASAARSLDEDAPPASAHPNRLLHLNRFLALLRDIGLDLPAALAAHRHLSLLVLSFALPVDHPADRSGAGRNTLVPDTWLEDHADLGIPTLRRAAALPLPTADEQFDQVVPAFPTRIRRELADAGVSG